MSTDYFKSIEVPLFPNAEHAAGDIVLDVSLVLEMKKSH